jgi:hypothetical protein
LPKGANFPGEPGIPAERSLHFPVHGRPTG